MNRFACLLILGFLFPITSKTQAQDLSLIQNIPQSELSFFYHMEGPAYGTHKYLVANSEKQVSYFLRNIQINTYKGYWEGMDKDGLVVVRNGIRYFHIPTKILRSNILTLNKDSLAELVEHSWRLEKPCMLKLLDSLSQSNVPHFLDDNLSVDFGYHVFNITYKEKSRKYADVESIRTKDKNKALLEIFQNNYPAHPCRINSCGSQGSTLFLEIHISCDSLLDFDNRFQFVRRQIEIDSAYSGGFKPYKYKIEYFVQDQNDPFFELLENCNPSKHTKIVIPKSIYPIGPPDRRYFSIKNLPANSYVKVFNKLGKLVFVSHDLKKERNGTDIDATPCEAGTYSYVIHTPEHEYKGYVELIL